MREELEVLGIVAARLESAGLPYMVSGSMALNYYGQPRMTRDLDLVIDVSLADAEKLTSLFEGDCYCDLEDVRDAVRRRSMFNVIYLARVLKIDFIIRKDSPYRREEFSRRRRIALEGQAVWVVAPEDLILSKLHWARDSHSEMQLRDVRTALGAIAELDWPYLRRWAEELGVTGLLEEVSR